MVIYISNSGYNKMILYILNGDNVVIIIIQMMIITTLLVDFKWLLHMTR
jgi:hypothetical protein